MEDDNLTEDELKSIDEYDKLESGEMDNDRSKSE